MIITTAQMSAFKAQATRQFARRLVDYFESRFAGRVAHGGEPVPRGEELQQRVLELVEVARSFGISKELGVAQFVSLGLGYSREFHRLPRVAEMLSAPEFTPEQNVQRVLDAVIVAEARVV
jgi:hypothetical protein